LRASAALIGVVAVLSLGGAASAAPPALSLVDLGPSFSSPIFVASTSADPTAVYVVEQGGRVWRVVGGVTDPTPFLDLSKKVRYGGEQGLLSIAFSPNYATDQLVYAYYVSKKRRVTVSQFSMAVQPVKPGQKPKPPPETTLLVIDHRKFDNHNGGQLQFGSDGMLYAGVGDGGGGGDPLHSGQSTKSKLGKLWRAAGPTFKTWQIAGYGLRNPWRFSFDTNGDLYIGDVGQSSWEEVDYRSVANMPTPANYGWNRYEGTHDYSTGTTLNPPDSITTPLVFPVQEYDHSSGDCSIIGGYVYRGSAMTDEVGRYFYSDLCSGRVWSMAAGGGDNRLENITVNTPSSFGVDAAGELYVASLGDGKVYRVAESGP
jgi:glucose/arabinose dehydrogenase